MAGPGDIVPLDDVELPELLRATAAATGLVWPSSSESGLCEIGITYLTIADHGRHAIENVNLTISTRLAGNHSPGLTAFSLMHHRLAAPILPSHMISCTAAAAAIGSAYIAAAALVGLMKLRMIALLTRATAYLAAITGVGAVPGLGAVLTAIDQIGQIVLEAADAIVDEGTEVLSRLLGGAATLAEHYTSFAVPLLRGRPADVERAAVRTEPSAEPNIGARPTGTVNRRLGASAEVRRGMKRQAEAAEMLASSGYTVVNLDEDGSGKHPDYEIEGRIFEGYSPTTPVLKNMVTQIHKKLAQSDRQILYLKDSPFSPADVLAYLRRYPVSGPKELIIITADGTVIPCVP